MTKTTIRFNAKLFRPAESEKGDSARITGNVLRLSTSRSESPRPFQVDPTPQWRQRATEPGVLATSFRAGISPDSQHRPNQAETGK